ncbi:hypothetical protein ACOKWN_003864 [Vibrio parahaemolyticus]
MPKKINYGQMFVFPHLKKGRNTTLYVAKIPTVWSEKPFNTLCFSSRHYRNPKLMAQRYTEKFLKAYYGAARAEYIISIPQFIRYFQFGCRVHVYETHATSRGKRYPKIVMAWTEIVSEYNCKPTAVRRQSGLNYSPENRIEKHHQMSLKVARKRAELAMSYLSEEVFNFEYDLDFIKDSEH